VKCVSGAGFAALKSQIIVIATFCTVCAQYWIETMTTLPCDQ
jgi:hypothetical protein